MKGNSYLTNKLVGEKRHSSEVCNIEQLNFRRLNKFLRSVLQIKQFLRRCIPMPSQPTLLTCWICGKPVVVATCKTDEHGKAIHEACYGARLSLESATTKVPSQRLKLNVD